MYSLYNEQVIALNFKIFFDLNNENLNKNERLIKSEIKRKSKKSFVN